MPQSISAFIASGRLLSTVWLDRDIGGPPKYLVSKGLEDSLSLSDRVSAGSGVSDFDTTSSVVGGTFKSNISLVDLTVQFSRTEKRLVERGCVFHRRPSQKSVFTSVFTSFCFSQSSRAVAMALAIISEMSISEKSFRAHCLRGSGQLFARCPIFWQL